MAATFVFTGARAPERARLESWLEHARRVAGAQTASELPVSSGYAVWHLAAANYRVLARSVAVFADHDAAVADALRVAQAGERLRIRMVKNAALGAYGWYLADDDEPRATCARWYATERDRRDAIRLAVAALEEARPVLELTPQPRARVVGRAR